MSQILFGQKIPKAIMIVKTGQALGRHLFTDVTEVRRILRQPQPIKRLENDVNLIQDPIKNRENRKLMTHNYSCTALVLSDRQRQVFRQHQKKENYSKKEKKWLRKEKV